MASALAALAPVPALAAAIASLAAAAPPVPVTGGAAAVGGTSATVSGTVDPEGSPATYVFEYGTSTSYGQAAPVPPGGAGAGTAPVPVRAALTGLAPGTRYHYRLVATGPEGTVAGADRTFTTARPPEISRQRARIDAPDAATISAAVDPNGDAVAYHVEYGTSTRFGSQTPERSLPAGDAPVPVSLQLTGLRPRTTYYYRVVATSSAGTDRGSRRRLRTSRLLTGVSLAVAPRVASWGGEVTLGGRVSGLGVRGTPLALEALPFPHAGAWTEIATQRAGANGRYLFRVLDQRASTRYRVVTRSRVAVFSPVAESLSRVRVQRRVRLATRRRARIAGEVRPGVPGRISLQRRSRSGRWIFVRRATLAPASADRAPFRFTVRRMRRGHRYRLVAMPGAGSGYVRDTSGSVKVRRRPAAHRSRQRAAAPPAG